MKNIVQFLTIVSVGLLMTSCYYDDYTVAFEETSTIPSGTVVTYKADIAPMLVACTQCHGGATSPDMRNTQAAYNGLIANYVKKGNPAGSKLYTFAPGSPTSSHASFSNGVTLNATQLAKMKLWIETDAKFD